MAELGTDIGGVFDVDSTLSVVGGRRGLAVQILRRLFTPRGGLIGAPTYGYSLVALIGAPVPASVVEQRVLEQVLAEEEVADARCAVTLTQDTLDVAIQITDADGPFDLTIAASDLTVEVFLDGVLFAANDTAALVA